jgi:site-specific recombinase XerD
MERSKLQLVRSPTPHAVRLPEQDAKLLAEMLDAYATRRLGALRHRNASVSRDLAILSDFVRFTAKAPWYWTEEGFEQWCAHLAEDRHLAVSSQRHYQSTVRGFLQYLIDNVKFRNDVRRTYGLEIPQVCHRDNCIPHVYERELRQERRAFTHAEVSQLFDAYDRAIEEAGRFAAKDFRPLQRDKVLFFTIYAMGLRASECRNLNTTSFYPNASFPEFGRYGLLSVFGKGHAGSGPKHRTVPVTHAQLPPLLKWYEDSVRPHLLVNADPNEAALFISERGKRLALSTIEMRFHHALAFANLEDQGFVLHCLRHTSVTHESLRGLSTEANRRKHGHEHGATNQMYMHVSDEFVREEIDQMISSHMNSLSEDHKDD